VPCQLIFQVTLVQLKLCYIYIYIYIYEGHTESHEQHIFACELGTADEGMYGGRWNQLFCYPWVSCDVNSLHHMTSITPNKMADNDMSFRSMLSSNSLLKRKSLLQKFTRDFSVLMEVCAWVWTVFEDGNTSIQDEHRSGRPRTASTERNKERVDEIVQDDRRVNVDTIAQTLGIGHIAVQEMIESLGYRKVCARWVPRLLTKDQRNTSQVMKQFHSLGTVCK
jgi:hypothetical protein